MNISTISTVLSLIPVIISTIKLLEVTVPGAGVGTAKLAAVRGILEAADEGVTAIWPTLEKVITTIVTLFNSTIWKK